MNNYKKRFIRLFIGLILYSIGIVFTLKGNIGYAPWDVFHDGFSTTIGITFGTASIIVGFFILIANILLGEKFGIATVLNMFVIGLLIDLIMYLDLIPTAHNFFIGFIMIVMGMFIIALGSYFYIGSAFGAGPRDGLMVGLTRKTKLPIGLCRILIELTAALVGYKLGGLIGLGTIISAIAIGICIQITFKLLNFDTTTIEHETLQQTLTTIKSNTA